MESSLKFKVIRWQNDEELHDTGCPDKIPWVAKSLDRESRIPSKEYLIFSDMVEAFRDLVRRDGVTVHLFNEFEQPLLKITPELVEFGGLYEEEFSLMQLDGKFSSSTKISHEDRRPICPKCNQKAELEPAHWTVLKSQKAQWRWICVADDYAVSNQVDERFIPNGELASREVRELRARLRGEFSLLWQMGVMSEADAYKLLKQHLGFEKWEKVNFANMTNLQMEKAVSLKQEVIKRWKEQKKIRENDSPERPECEQPERAANEMRQLYSAIAHEDGEPTYLGDGMYLFPDGRIGES